MSVNNVSPDLQHALHRVLHQAASSIEFPDDARRRITAAGYRVHGGRSGVTATLLAAAVVGGAAAAAALVPGGTDGQGTTASTGASQSVNAQLVAEITSALETQSTDIERVETTTTGVAGSTTQVVSPDGRTIRVTTRTAAGDETDEVISPSGELFVDYPTRTWWKSPSAVKVEGTPAPTSDPAALPDLLRSGKFVRTGTTAEIDGVAGAFELATSTGVETPTHIWVDPATDLPLRISTGAVQRDVTWLDPATGSDQLHVEPPAGFAEIAPPVLGS